MSYGIENKDFILNQWDCNNLSVSELYDIAYNQGREDEKRENEQDAYHRGYIDGKAKCSFDNELKIRSDVVETFENWIFEQDEIFFPVEAIAIIRKKLKQIKGE